MNDFVSVIFKVMGRKNVERLKNEFITELAKYLGNHQLVYKRMLEILGPGSYVVTYF